MSVVSIEARVFTAARVLSLLTDTRRAEIAGRPEGPRPPLPDARGFALDAAAVLPLDPAAAALVAEAWIAASLRLPRAALARARAKHPVRLREEPQPLALQAIRSIVGHERNAPRREAVLAAYTERLGDVATAARAVVDALRGAFEALPVALRAVHAPPAAEADAFLAATDDLWRELDQRVLRTLELDPARLTWGDRLRSFAGPSLLREVPPATWSALAFGWWSRVGNAAWLRGAGDHLGASSPQAEGVHALIDAAEGRALLLGRPSPSAWDAAEVLGAGSQCAGAVAARGLWSAHRRGVDRFADGVLHALGRRLSHETTFLHRAAQLDGLARARVRVETLHAEVARLRWDAVMARFAHDALGRAPQLTARFVESVTRAWGIAPPPAWAPHLVTAAMDGGGPWGGRWGERFLGARGEVVLRERLRSRYDEDWHRNPHAGEWLRTALDALRVDGAAGWSDEPGMTPAAQARRLTEDYLRAG
ncbi:MAG: hypothetical protein U0325_16905 [Polyangiales bacterium]